MLSSLNPAYHRMSLSALVGRACRNSTSTVVGTLDSVERQRGCLYGLVCNRQGNLLWLTLVPLTELFFDPLLAQ